MTPTPVLTLCTSVVGYGWRVSRALVLPPDVLASSSGHAVGSAHRRETTATAVQVLFCGSV